MKILICGNIASGKSALIEKLKEIFPDYAEISIDNFRNEFGDGTLKGEDLARDKFVEKINSNDKCFIECTGTGLIYTKIKNIIDVKILLKTKRSVCELRFKNREKDVVLPLSWKSKFDIEKDLRYLEGCHNKTRYDLTLLGNSHKSALQAAARIKSLQRCKSRLL